MTGIIILSITLAVFLLLAAFGVYSFFRIDWPTGKRIEETFKDYKVTLIYSKQAEDFFTKPPNVVCKLCACAAWATGTAWMEQRKPNSPTAESLKWSVVHVLHDEEYERIYDRPFNVKSNGTLRYMSYRRSEIPIIACRASAFMSTESDGNLVIHELTHHIIKIHKGISGLPPYGDLDHTSPEFWYGRSESPLEVRAHKEFLDNKSKI